MPSSAISDFCCRSFGQPRQDDLLDYLRTLLGKDIAIGDLLDLQIRLDPRAETSA